MRLIVVLVLSIATFAYLDQFPHHMELPLPLIGFSALIVSMLFVLVKA